MNEEWIEEFSSGFNEKASNFQFVFIVEDSHSESASWFLFLFCVLKDTIPVLKNLLFVWIMVELHSSFISWTLNLHLRWKKAYEISKQSPESESETIITYDCTTNVFSFFYFLTARRFQLTFPFYKWFNKIS